MTKKPFEPIKGVAAQIGYYLAGLEYTRKQIRDGAAGLSKEQISARLLPDAHSIGQLIIHTAEAEWWWIQCVVGGKRRKEFEKRELYHITEDTDYHTRGHSADFCISHLDEIGCGTLETLKNFDDGALEEFFGWKNNREQEIEMSLRGIFTHLIDHQATHKGQILMLKRLLG